MPKRFIFGSLFFLIVFRSGISFAVDPLSDSSASHAWTIGVTGWEAFICTGYVQVRELQYSGDKLSLKKDLGLENLVSPGIWVSYRKNKLTLLSVSIERYIFIGHHAMIHNNILFNGTLLKGADGLSMSKTEFTHLRFRFEKSMNDQHQFYPVFIAGLLYDGIDFKINGTILPGSPRSEPEEHFISQSLPYPFTGVRLNRKLSAHSEIALEVSGTYIPLFKSFFNEGGKMHLKYSSAEASVNYQISKGAVAYVVAFRWRMLRTFEESAEDSNDFFLSASGIGFHIQYRL